MRPVFSPLSRVTTAIYDAAGRQTETIDARGFRTTVVLDGAGKNLALVDASGNRTTWAYDSDGRVATETDPRGKVTSYAYDDGGRLTETTDRLGRKVQSNYDDWNRKTGEIWKTSAGAEVQRQTFAYDDANRLTVAADPDGTYTMAYDANGRTTAVLEPFGQVLTMGYDLAGRRTQVNDSQGGVTTTSYDSAGEVTAKSWSTGSASGKITYSYDPRGMVSGESRFNSSAGTTKIGSEIQSYDDAGRLTNITQNNGGGTTLWNGTYTYDSADRLTAKQENGTTTSYAYDKGDQLIKDGANATITYDGTGNRTNSGYVTTTGNRSTNDGTWTYTYDDVGNQVGKSNAGATWTYTYDYNGQMTSATNGGSTVTYSYDAFGNQIQRVDNTTTARYSEDGWDTSKPRAVGTENFDVWGELNGSNALQTRRIYGSDFDEPIAKVVGSTQTWYGLDQQNSVRSVFDNSGTVVGTITYNAFGGITSGTSDGLGYTGARTDSTTGLVGNRARMYDPATGRWLNEDPMGFGAGDPNLYRAMGNNVTVGRDPSGMQVTEVTSTGPKLNPVEGGPRAGHDGEGPMGDGNDNPGKPAPVPNDSVALLGNEEFARFDDRPFDSLTESEKAVRRAQMAEASKALLEPPSPSRLLPPGMRFVDLAKKSNAPPSSRPDYIIQEEKYYIIQEEKFKGFLSGVARGVGGFFVGATKLISNGFPDIKGAIDTGNGRLLIPHYHTVMDFAAGWQSDFEGYKAAGLQPGYSGMAATITNLPIGSSVANGLGMTAGGGHSIQGRDFARPLTPSDYGEKGVSIVADVGLAVLPVPKFVPKGGEGANRNDGPDARASRLSLEKHGEE